MRSKALLLTWLFSIALSLVFAKQERLVKEKITFETVLQQLRATGGVPLMDEEWEEVLYTYYQQPLDLNTVTPQQLRQLKLLSESQIQHFFSHLHQNGFLLSIYELQVIPSFDITTIQRILPFVTVTECYPSALAQTAGMPKIPIGHCTIGYEHTLEEPLGYQVNPKTGLIPYQGSPEKFLLKLKFSLPNGIDGGLAARKYPGEMFSWDVEKEHFLFDTWTAYLNWQHTGFLRQIIIGNYQVGYGQGLLTDASFSLAHTPANIVSILRTTNNGIKPHVSFTSIGFRGIAAKIGYKNWENTTYYAYNSLDGNCLKDSPEEAIYVTAIQRGGIHKTLAAIHKKAQIGEQILGNTLIYKSNNQQNEIGLQTIYTHYQVPIRNLPHIPNHYFSGDTNYNMGLFFRYLWRNIHFFGESALCRSGGKGNIIGTLISLTSSVAMALLYRHYDPNFHSLYGKAFGVNTTKNSNEKGFYIGVDWQVYSNLTLQALGDFFAFPAPTKTISMPAKGYQWLVKVNYQIAQNYLATLQYKTLHKAAPIPKRIRQVQQNPYFTRRNYKFQLKQHYSKTLQATTAFHASTHHLHPEMTFGYLLAQRLDWQTGKINWTGQCVWFDTDSKNALYVQEKGLQQGGCLPASFTNIGIKTSLMMNYKFAKHWQVIAKYIFLCHPEQDHLGSGNEKIIGNTKNDIKGQIRFCF